MSRRGEIVLARFPYADGSEAKLRPMLVLVESPGRYRDYVVMFISSQLSQAVPGLDWVVRPSDPDFPRTGLKVASALRVARIASISDGLVVGTLGRLDTATFDQIIRRLVRLLRTGA